MKKLTKQQIKKICSLTDDQKKAFEKLRKAYQGCEKAGIFFYNLYGNLYPFDRNKINDIENQEYFINNNYKNVISNYDIDVITQSPIKIENEWSDDNHILYYNESRNKK